MSDQLDLEVRLLEIELGVGEPPTGEEVARLRNVIETGERVIGPEDVQRHGRAFIHATPDD